MTFSKGTRLTGPAMLCRSIPHHAYLLAQLTLTVLSALSSPSPLSSLDGEPPERKVSVSPVHSGLGEGVSHAEKHLEAQVIKGFMKLPAAAVCTESCPEAIPSSSHLDCVFSGRPSLPQRDGAFASHSWQMCWPSGAAGSLNGPLSHSQQRSRAAKHLFHVLLRLWP